MSYPRRSSASLVTHRKPAPAQTAWTDRSDGRPQRTKPLTRRYEVAYLTADGQIENTTRLAPALPQFEDAFGAVARGTLITTDRGPVSVEDLLPGDRVLTMENGPEALRWKGSIMIYPASATPGIEGSGLVRITADRFGYAKPMADLLLGPAARILHSHGRLPEIIGTPSAFAPARGFIDGSGVFRIDPISPVPVYHLAFSGHRTIRANGIPIESYHPGLPSNATLDPELLALFLAFFPHIEKLSDFGPLSHPRLTTFEIEEILAY